MITQPTIPVPGESLAEAGERIRTAIPIRGAAATADEHEARSLAADAALSAHRVRPRERAWHTAQLVDGRIAGIWARSTDEAELHLTIWRSQRCNWVVADPAGEVRAEYFPRSRRMTPGVGRAFPLAPPRRPRDPFTTQNSHLTCFARSLAAGPALPNPSPATSERIRP